MKALIVDDDKYVWMGLKNLIPWADIDFAEVLWADNGASAYKIAMNTQPDLIITDVKMPVMNGIELCKKISETSLETYIIMLSAYDEFEFARAALKLNVKDYILKPLDEENLAQLISKIQLMAAENKQKQHFQNILYNKDLSNRISTSLNEANVEDISNFFHHDLPAMNLKYTEHKHCCLFLIDLLFNHLQIVNFSFNEKINKQRNDAVLYITSSKDKIDMSNYVYDLYMDIIKSTPAKHPDSNLLVDEMCLYIEKNYPDPELSVAKIAQDMHIAVGYASSLFKKHKGVNLNNYLNGLRIQKACMLLENTPMKVSTVGQMVGITDPNYFPKIFKKIKGVSPKEYRNIHF